MNRRDLKAVSGISPASIAKLGKGENVTTDMLVRICNGLGCDLKDITELEDEALQGRPSFMEGVSNVPNAG